ncbi:MAG: hypothetical protein MR878_02715 [Campylobacter sp.]|nr:hypothetical protein [Campylobacter sp.]
MTGGWHQPCIIPDLTFFVILGLDPRISIGNSRIPCVIASEQSDRSNL